MLAIILLLMPGAALLRAQSGMGAVTLVSPENGAEMGEGKVTLAWEDVSSTFTVFELQQASSPDFANAIQRYIGPDRASVLTGYPAGTRYFRVRGVEPEQGPWSAPLEVRFEYIGMETVWVLMAAGSLVFVMTVGAILMGHFRREDRGEQS